MLFNNLIVDMMRTTILAVMATIIAALPAYAEKGKVDCTSYLRDRDLYAKWDSLPSYVQKALWRYTDDYVNLKNEDMREDLQAAIKEARAKVKENLGWLPEIRRHETPWAPFLLSDVKLFKPGTQRCVLENAISFYAFKLKEDDYNVLISENIHVVREYRRNGLSELMLGEILAAHPWVKKIVVEELQKTNEQMVREFLDDGKNCRDAIRESPEYKQLAFFGFTKFTEAECIPQGRATQIYFTVKRP